jgi:EAL and modified HD-GYP domain-containing signal transduction protein
LRYANSAALFSGGRVSSIREALMRLGSRTVLRWLAILALSEGGGGSHQLLVTGLIRARLCELLALDDPLADRHRAYTSGLLSVIDGLLDAPLPELLDQLPLDEPLIRAIVDHEGPEGTLLSVVLAYERGDFSGAEAHHDDPDALAGHYRAAVTWAQRAAGAVDRGQISRQG